MAKIASLLTSYAGFGDILYQTPTIRLLRKMFDHVDVWCRNPEPFLNNPNVRHVFKMDSFFCPDPSDFYFKYHFSLTSATMQGRPQSNFHATDFFSTGACNLILRDKEKNLDLFWADADSTFVRSIMDEHGLVGNKSADANFVVLSPALTWPSRTLPLSFYKELIERIQANGDKVVLVGKNVHYVDFDPKKDSEELQKQLAVKEEPKSLYAPEEFPGVICLYDKFTFHQLGAFYAQAKLAINTENGNMVTAFTNNDCWNIYLPTLTAPEFRVPHRNGTMKWKSIVVGNRDDYYPASAYSLTPSDLKDVPIRHPMVDDVFDAYLNACSAFRRGETSLGGL